MDLKTLTEINAPSGHEQAIRRFLLDELKKLGFAPVLDRMGNVVVVKEGTGDAPRKRVMVSAHMDEVGLIEQPRIILAPQILGRSSSGSLP